MNFFIYAGEASADLHGAQLACAIRQIVPDTQLEGVAGPAMRNQNIASFMPMEKFQVMGFSDVLKVLPRLCQQFYQIRNHILKKKPHAVILIDSPDFNLRMAHALRKKNYTGKLIQYVSPSVWAWKKNRITSMARNLDLLLTIYPFEPSYFAKSGLPTYFIGNPVVEYVGSYIYQNDWKKQLNIPDKPYIALFPGSRPSEVKRNLPILLKSATLVQNRFPETAFVISCAHPNLKPIIASLSHTLSHPIYLVPKQFSYELMRDARIALAKSGTVTLELACHHCPTVVNYELSFLNKFLAKYIFRLNLPYYCIVNILGEKMIFPELIHEQNNPEAIARAAISLFEDSEPRKLCIHDCETIKKLLYVPHSSQLAAQKILEISGY